MTDIATSLAWAHPPYRLSGAVYGALMNEASALARLGDAVHRPPYKAPPAAPVLCVLPRNTHAPSGSVVPRDEDVPAYVLGASVGLVLGRAASRLARDEALQAVAGVLLMADLSVPHDSHYRPAVRQKARDGSCLFGPLVATPAQAGDLDAIELVVRVDGAVAQTCRTSSLLRGAAALLADVTEFMTLAAGDVLMLGTWPDAPVLGPGQAFSIQARGLGTLEGRIA